MNNGQIFRMCALSAILFSAPLLAEELSAESVKTGNSDKGRSSALSREQLDGHAYKTEAEWENTRLNGQKRPAIAEQAVSESTAAIKQGSPILVARNSIVSMEYALGRLTIQTEGRAMSQGRAGELVRIMNLNSKSIVAATVIGPSKVVVK